MSVTVDMINATDVW